MGTARTGDRCSQTLAVALALVAAVGCQASPPAQTETAPSSPSLAPSPAGEGSAAACDDRVADFDRWFEGYCGLPHSGLEALAVQPLELAVWRGDVEIAEADDGPWLYVTAEGPMMRGFSSNLLMPFDAAQWPGPAMPPGPGESSGSPVLAIAVDASMASVREAVGHLASAGFDRARLPYRYDDSALRAGVAPYQPGSDSGDETSASTALEAMRAHRRAARVAASGGCEQLVSMLERDGICAAPTPLSEVVRACGCSVDLDALRGLLLSRIVEPQIGWVAVTIGGDGPALGFDGQWGEHAATHFEAGSLTSEP